MCPSHGKVHSEESRMNDPRKLIAFINFLVRPDLSYKRRREFVLMMKSDQRAPAQTDHKFVKLSLVNPA